LRKQRCRGNKTSGIFICMRIHRCRHCGRSPSTSPKFPHCDVKIPVRTAFSTKKHKKSWKKHKKIKKNCCKIHMKSYNNLNTKTSLQEIFLWGGDDRSDVTSQFNTKGEFQAHLICRLHRPWQKGFRENLCYTFLFPV
jgi:hypothetical protein